MKAMQFRHACKLFDESRKISDTDFATVLEAGRLSPSSFGLEPWHFLVVENAAAKAALRPSCWDQPQITTCSHFVVLLAKKPQFFQRGSAYLDASFKRRASTPEQLAAVNARFENFIQNDLGTDVQNWAKMQCYLAGANMMTAAAYLGIDSCPIEGFSYAQFKQALIDAVPAFNPDEEDIAFGICFGYRVNPQKPAYRWTTEQIATFIK
jgi:nitroreductase